MLEVVIKDETGAVLETAWRRDILDAGDIVRLQGRSERLVLSEDELVIDLLGNQAQTVIVGDVSTASAS